MSAIQPTARHATTRSTAFSRLAQVSGLFAAAVLVAIAMLIGA